MYYTFKIKKNLELTGWPNRAYKSTSFLNFSPAILHKQEALISTQIKVIKFSMYIAHHKVGNLAPDNWELLNIENNSPVHWQNFQTRELSLSGGGPRTSSTGALYLSLKANFPYIAVWVYLNRTIKAPFLPSAAHKFIPYIVKHSQSGIKGNLIHQPAKYSE